ncbi:unnamed protein product [Symbiodinium sp. CCMP2456]|nr:unnamed protein product [Symbiodinium sp. CCMP2456]
MGASSCSAPENVGRRGGCKSDFLQHRCGGLRGCRAVGGGSWTPGADGCGGTDPGRDLLQRRHRRLWFFGSLGFGAGAPCRYAGCECAHRCCCGGGSAGGSGQGWQVAAGSLLDGFHGSIDAPSYGREPFSSTASVCCSLLRLQKSGCTALISACGRASDWASGLAAFREMPSRLVRQDVLAYNAAMDCCRAVGHWKEALSLFSEMSILSLEPSAGSVTTLLSVCRSGRAWQQALALAPLAVADYGFNSAISACADAGRWEHAISLLHDMEQHSLVQGTMSFNAALNSLVRQGGHRWETSICFLSRMVQIRLQPDEFSMSPSIAALGGSEGWPVALTLLGGMTTRGFEASAFPRNAALARLEDSSQWQTATDMLEAGWRKRSSPDVLACNSVISSCSRAGEAQQARRLLDRMPEMRLAPDTVSVNAALASADWSEALELLSFMSDHDLQVDAFTISTSIRASAGERGRQLFRDLSQRGVELNQVAYNAAIGACASGGRWQEAGSLLQEMDEVAVVPDMISLNSAVDVCEKGGQWQMALLLLAVAEQRMLRLDAVGANSALSSCEKCGQLGSSLRLLARMVHLRLSNEISYTCAIGSCEKSGDWQLALHLLEEMQEVSLPPGEIAFRAVISACPGPQWPLAVNMLGYMESANVFPHEISFNAALAAAARGAAPAPVAAALLRRMRAAEVLPDAGSYKAAAAIFEMRDKAQPALRVYQEMSGCVGSLLSAVFADAA